MRIQHNIPAMNAYRNYTNNAAKLSKNLEKLSSGYKINRAGDDAAGLAISEKMRAQVTGLDAAGKNVKDGISLVKTAEGAMQEVQDMLSRMKYLATQSSNGTYQNEVDRENLQKEVNALKTEINRIADSSNFNGQKLLNGELSANGSAAGSKGVEADLSKLGLDLSLADSDIKAVKGEYDTSDLVDANVANIKDGDTMTMTVNFTDANGVKQTVDIKLTFKKNDAGDIKDIYLDDGTKEGKKLTSKLAATGTATQAEVAKAFSEALGKNDTIRANFTVTDSTNALSFTARNPGSAGAVLEGFTLKSHINSADKTYATKVDVSAEPTDATKGYDMSKAKAWDGDTDTLKDSIFEINGKKFVFVSNTANLDDKALKALNDADVKHWVKNAGAAITGTDIKTMVEKIKKETGLDVKQGTVDAQGTFSENSGATDVHLVFGTGESATGGKGGGLTLQIGDTADEYNQMKVQVSDMHTKALGVAALDISTITGAQAAIETITDAINKVSSTRGDLGAIQNRLEHTQNNLSVMKENIQDAEATIRDTDVADEMTVYTKNNILLQSAQAMLAQANQMPQGVLQLLQ